MLTADQITALRAVVQADQTAAALAVAADDIGLANWLNEPADPAYTIWRHDISIEEANDVLVWTEVDALTPGKARIWEWMSRLGVLDARKLNIRRGISDAFAPAPSTRAALQTLSKRLATRAERALASGVGTDGNPGIATFVGEVSYAEASTIRS